jgi:hypothetical protein
MHEINVCCIPDSIYVSQVLYHLKRSPDVQALLGTPLSFDYDTNDVRGSVNMFKGIADIQFTLQGGQDDSKKKKGVVTFKGSRRRDSGDEWESKVFTLKTEDGQILDLQ